MKPSLFVRYNREIVITVYLRKNNSTNLVRYSSEFVITVIDITEFYCKSSYFLNLNATIFLPNNFFHYYLQNVEEVSYSGVTPSDSKPYFRAFGICNLALL